MVAWQEVEMRIYLEWMLKDINGEIIWVNTIDGSGKDRYGYCV